MTSQFLILDPLRDPRSHQEHGFLPVVTGPQAGGMAGVGVRKGSRFTALHVGPHTPSSGGEAAAGPTACCLAQSPWNGKRSPGTKSPPREPDNGLSSVTRLGHLAQGTGASLPGRDPAWAATSGPSLHALPSAAFLLPEEPTSLFPLPFPSLEVRGDQTGLRELLGSIRGNRCQTHSTQPILNQDAVNGLLAFSSPVLGASLVSTVFLGFTFLILSTLEFSTCHCPPGSHRCDSSFHVIAISGG